jgi:hypothetical protein
VAINTQRVIVGGLAAGVVALVLDSLINGFLLAGTWEAAMTALNPDILASMESPSTMVGFAIVDLIYGILLVWLYASIRPRFGPGAGTALKAATVAWLIGGVAWGSLTVIGIFTWSLFVVGGLCWLVVSAGAALVGARLYREEAA